MYNTIFPLKRFQTIETPFYYYDLELLGKTLKELREASNYPGFCVHYAVKANSNPEVLRHIALSGLGADTVSIGEVQAAVIAGFPAKKIVFSGVGKTEREIRMALEIGIGCFNVESREELKVIEEVASEMRIDAPVSIRINPNIDAHTHQYITTGLSENKFGVTIETALFLIKECRRSKCITFKGIHFHIGSQIVDLKPYILLCQRINEIIEMLDDGDTLTINVGGGLGIDYDNPDDHPVPDFKSYFKVFRDNLLLKKGQELHFELGRAVVAQCGSLICRTIYVKEGKGKKFVILDGGMTALIRPALYQAHHVIQNLSSESVESEFYDVVGPICESSDVFGVNEKLPITSRGDVIAIRSAGAYGEVMASTYNCRPLPKSVFSR